MLSDERREIRINAILNAAEMVSGHVETGMTHEDMGYTEDEFELYVIETKYVAMKLLKMAQKLMKDDKEI